MDEYGLRVARDYAWWHLGDPSWANLIIGAYLNPERVQRELVEEKAGDDE